MTHDYQKAFDAVIKCCSDFAWDAAVPSMVAHWSGLTQAVGLNYFGLPGIDIPPDVCFQYREPAEKDAYMKREEYDEFIENPTRFLYETWLPRVAGDIRAKGCPVSLRHNLSFVKGSMAMWQYFSALGTQAGRLRSECGAVPAFQGMLKAPLDVLGDKFRGYVGLAFDLLEIPDKVLAACKALMADLGYIALTSADPNRQVPIPIWMHRGCTPFISKQHFETIFWPTLKPMLDALWAQGNQVLLYAEGRWDAHLERFAELPAESVIFHLDRTDPVAARRVLGDKFCLSGGVPNALLAFGTPDEVRACCRNLIETTGKDGGYIMDAGAIMQNDTTVENFRAMVDATRAYGVYRSPSSPTPPHNPSPAFPQLPSWIADRNPRPGTCFSWEEKSRELPPICGDEALFQAVWAASDEWAYLYPWYLVIAF